MILRAALLLFLMLASAVQAGPLPAALLDQAVERLQVYLRIDTTNPPGNEMATLKLLKGYLDEAGIESTTYESAPGRGVLVARLKGNGSARPILLMNHMDVVAADATQWKEPPFSGALKEGYIWGRGAVDMKGLGIMQLQAFIALHQSGQPLKRDVIFMAVSDEETGGVHGVQYMWKSHPEVFDNVEFVLDEGSRGIAKDGKPRYWEVVVGEKAPLWLKVVAKGRPGHGSRPFPNAATHRLIRALGRIAAWETPINVRPEIQSFFAAVAPFQSEPRRTWFKNIRQALTRPEVRKDLSTTPDLNALVRDTVAITLLSGSNKMNVIYGEASGGLDCRLLPGSQPEAFVQQVRKVLADDTLDIEILERNISYGSPPDSAAMQAHPPGVGEDHAGGAGDYADCPGGRATPASFALAALRRTVWLPT